MKENAKYETLLSLSISSQVNDYISEVAYLKEKLFVVSFTKLTIFSLFLHFVWVPPYFPGIGYLGVDSGMCGN